MPSSALPNAPVRRRLSRVAAAFGIVAALASANAVTAPAAGAAASTSAATSTSAAASTTPARAVSALAPAVIPDSELPHVVGPHRYSVSTVADWRTPIEFGAVDLFTPTDIEGRLPTVVVMPGLTGSRRTVRYIAEDLASHGFAVMLMDSFSIADADAVRTIAMRRGVSWLAYSSPIRGRVDDSRIGVWGFSFGATAALNTATTSRSPSVRAAVAVFPLSTLSIYPLVPKPALVLGGENDVIAPPALNARIAYNVAQGVKAYGQLDKAQHLDPTTDDGAISSLTVSWFKIHLGVNSEYTQFLCPRPNDPYVEIWESRGLC